MMENDLSGDLDSIEFLQRASNETALLRRVYLVINQQILFGVIMVSILLRNACRAGYVVFAYPCKLAPWCCLAMNLVGALLLVFIAFPSMALGFFSCYGLVWAIVAGVTFSLTLTNIVLFERAYLAYNRSKWFLVLGIILISVPGPAYIIIVLNAATPSYSKTHGCYIQYKPYLPYVRLALDLPSSLIFSVIFLMVIYRQYKRYKEACWKKLAKAGVITMLLVVASNMLCFIVNAIEVLKEVGNVIYVFDWVLTATLIVNNIYNLHMLPQSDKSNRSYKYSDKTAILSIEDQITTCNRFGITGITTTYMFE